MLILDFKSLETILKIPGEKLLFLEETDRISNLTSSSKRNSEHFYRGNEDRLSTFSQDINIEDPFYDTTMRTRRTQITDNLVPMKSFGDHPLRGKLIIPPQKSVEFINRQINMLNKQNQKAFNNNSILHQEFQKSKMTSKININKERFFKLATSFKGVCLARCSPSMKSLVTEVLCEQMNKIVLAIGDGGNDVGMIQISHVGVGILGKEGNQAALAADFNINQFRYYNDKK